MLGGDNPYDVQNYDLIQSQDKAAVNQPLRMWNPPWVLPLIMPFGLLERPYAQIFWLIICIAAILFCAEQIWKLYGGHVNQRWQSWLIIFIFAPTLLVLAIGQISPLIFLGLTGFLLFITNPKKEWLAGVFASLLLIKPQLLLILLFTIFIWAVWNKKWLFFVGFIGSILLLTGISLVFNNDILQQYLAAISNDTPLIWASPTLGAWLRLIFGIQHQWLQYLPTLMGLIILFLFWTVKRPRQWIWLKQFPSLLFLALFTSPYSWTYDLVLLAIPVILAFILSKLHHPITIHYLIVSIFLFINLVYFFLQTKLNDFWFVWFTPVIWLFYLIAVNNYRLNKNMAQAITS